MFSVIICSRDERRFGAVAGMYRRLLAGRAAEVIRVCDARSLADGYNRAVRHSRGDLLIFSHDAFADRYVSFDPHEQIERMADRVEELLAARKSRPREPVFAG